MNRLISALLLLLLLTGGVAAQSVDDLGVDIGDIIGRLDLDVPDSPAFAVLGITPQNVINPDTPAELATAVFVGDDGAGNGQEGLAVEFRPFLMALGDSMTLGRYVNNRWLARAAVSFADTSGSDSSDKANRQALGITFTPIDDRDPLASAAVNACLGDAQDDIAGGREAELSRQLRDAITSGDQEAIDAAEAAMSAWFDGERDAFLERAATRCLEAHSKDTANARQLQIGIAYHDSEVALLDETGTALWVSYAHPVGSRGSLIAHARIGNDLITAVPDEEGAYRVGDEFIVGVRYRMGDASRAILLEAAFKDESVTGGRDDSYSVALLGVEFRVVESLWIQFAIGQTFGAAGDDALALSGQFRWALSKTRLWPGGPGP